MPRVTYPYTQEIPMGGERYVRVVDRWFRTELEAREEYKHLTENEDKEATQPRMQKDGTWVFTVLP